MVRSTGRVLAAAAVLAVLLNGALYYNSKQRWAKTLVSLCVYNLTGTSYGILRASTNNKQITTSHNCPVASSYQLCTIYYPA